MSFHVRICDVHEKDEISNFEQIKKTKPQTPDPRPGASRTSVQIITVADLRFYKILSCGPTTDYFVQYTRIGSSEDRILLL